MKKPSIIGELKEELKEESIILVSIVKWFILSSIIGLIVGCSTAGFLKLIHFSSDATKEFTPWYFLIIPFIFWLNTILVREFAPNAEGHGTEKIIEAIHKRRGYIKPSIIPVKLITTIMTIASGGSVGKEGPCAQIGAGLASLFASLGRVSPADRKKLVICGISAGFAAVFGTPISGAIFAVEVIFVGSVLYEVLLPSFIAAIIGHQVANYFGIHHLYVNTDFTNTQFSELFFLKLAIAGLFFGFCSFLLIESFRFTRYISHKIKLTKPSKALLGGAVLVLLTFIFGTKYLGLGLETIQDSLSGDFANPWDFFVKTVFTTITLSFGGSGGIVTPTLFIGSTAGSLFGQLFNVDVATMAAIGLVSVLAGSTNAPIACGIMSVELFGPEVAPYAGLACVISFLMSGHRSVFPSQVLAIRKSQSIDVRIGKEITQARAQIHLRHRGFAGIFIRIFNFLRHKIKGDR